MQKQGIDPSPKSGNDAEESKQGKKLKGKNQVHKDNTSSKHFVVSEKSSNKNVVSD